MPRCPRCVCASFAGNPRSSLDLTGCKFRGLPRLSDLAALKPLRADVVEHCVAERDVELLPMALLVMGGRQVFSRVEHCCPFSEKYSWRASRRACWFSWVLVLPFVVVPLVVGLVAMWVRTPRFLAAVGRRPCNLIALEFDRANMTIIDCGEILLSGYQCTACSLKHVRFMSPNRIYVAVRRVLLWCMHRALSVGSGSGMPLLPQHCPFNAAAHVGYAGLVCAGLLRC